MLYPRRDCQKRNTHETRTLEQILAGYFGEQHAAWLVLACAFASGHFALVSSFSAERQASHMPRRMRSRSAPLHVLHAHWHPTLPVCGS